MDRHQVVSTLDSLANGIDPTTGGLIPHDLFHSAEVVRALFTAANLLRGADQAETVRAESSPAPLRPGPSSAGSRWTEQEDTLLCHAFAGGTPIGDIARQHARTRGAITSRLVKLGRIDPASVKTRERGARVVS